GRRHPALRAPWRGRQDRGAAGTAADHRETRDVDVGDAGHHRAGTAPVPGRAFRAGLTPRGVHRGPGSMGATPPPDEVTPWRATTSRTTAARPGASPRARSGWPGWAPGRGPRRKAASF